MGDPIPASATHSSLSCFSASSIDRPPLRQGAGQQKIAVTWGDGNRTFNQCDSLLLTRKTQKLYRELRSPARAGRLMSRNPSVKRLPLHHAVPPPRECATSPADTRSCENADGTKSIASSAGPGPSSAIPSSRGQDVPLVSQMTLVKNRRASEYRPRARQSSPRILPQLRDPHSSRAADRTPSRLPTCPSERSNSGQMALERRIV